MNGGVSQRWRFGFVAIYLLLILSPFLSSFSAPIQASSAQAISTTVPSVFQGGQFQFIDRMRVGFFKNGSTTPTYQVHDAGLDTDFSYKNADTGIGQSNDGQVCDLQISVADSSIKNLFHGGTATTAIVDPNSPVLQTINVVYSIYHATPRNHCDPAGSFQTSIQDPANFNITYKWQSSNSLSRVDAGIGGPDLTFVDANKTVNFGGTGSFPGGTYEVYLRQSDSDRTCQDFMLISQAKTDTMTAYYEEIGPKGAGDGLGKATGPASLYPGLSGCFLIADNNGHYQSGTIILAGWTAAAGKAPVVQCTDPASCKNATDTCNISGGFGWVLCPLIDMGKAIIDPLKDAVVSILQFPPLTKDNFGGAYAVWGAFRGLANVFFVLIFLAIIFSQTLSIGLNNYDIKKMLPRLVVAAILVQFSWLIMQLAVDVTNILGAGISSIIQHAIGTVNGVGTNPSDVISSVVTGITFAIGLGLALAFALPILFALFSAILAILAVFITLEFRQLLIVILVVLSPFAFVAWILPNTENLFRTWLKTFTRLLLMYPLIVLIFAFAGVVSRSAIANTAGNNWVAILASLLPIAVLFAVPWTFKWAGSAMNAAAGYFSGRAAGLSGKLRGSQFAKDRQTGRQERGLKQAHRQFGNTSFNATGGRAIRALGRARSGTGLLGATAARRRENAYASYLKTRGDEFEKQFNALQFTGDDYENMAMGKSVKGVRADVAARTRAAEKLAEIDGAAFERVQNANAGQPWFEQAKADKISKLAETMPHLVSPASIKNMSADKMVKLDPAAFSHLKGNLSDDRIVSLLKDIATSQARRGQVNVKQSAQINGLLQTVPESTVRDSLLNVFSPGGVNADAVSSLRDTGSPGETT